VIYRHELAIEPLARLRVHQLMARVGSRPGSEAATSEVLEIVRRLNRLDHLERLEPPFELCDARSVLAEWIERSERRPGARSGESVATAQAA
jgi:hypothetical protein